MAVRHRYFYKPLFRRSNDETEHRVESFARQFVTLAANIQRGWRPNESKPDHHPAYSMPNLTKRDLVLQISKETGIIQGEVFTVVQKALADITDALACGRDVALRNFGVFEVSLRKSRIGRNPNNWKRMSSFRQGQR